MEPEVLERFLLKYGGILKKEIQDQLNKPVPYAPGYNKDAYNNGRNPNFSGNAPKSAFGIGNLSKSVEVVYDRDQQTLGVLMASYWKYVEYGVPPKPEYLTGKGSGQSVLIPILKAWAASKGIDPNAAYAIRRNIFKFGIAPTNFYGQALDNIADKIAADFGDDMDDYIDTLFDRIID